MTHGASARVLVGTAVERRSALSPAAVAALSRTGRADHVGVRASGAGVTIALHVVAVLLAELEVYGGDGLAVEVPGTITGIEID